MVKQKKSGGKNKKNSIPGLAIVIVAVLAAIFLQKSGTVDLVPGCMGAYSNSYTDTERTTTFSVYCYGSENPIEDYINIQEDTYTSCKGSVTVNSNYIQSIACSMDGNKARLKAYLTDAGKEFCQNQYDKVVGKGKIILTKPADTAVDECTTSGAHTCDYGTNSLMVCYKASDGHYAYKVSESCDSDEICTLSGCVDRVSDEPVSKIGDTVSAQPIEITNPVESTGKSVDVLSVEVITPSGTTKVDQYDVVTIVAKVYVQKSGEYIFEGAMPRPTASAASIAPIDVTGNTCNPDDLDYPSIRKYVEGGQTYTFNFKAVALKDGTIRPQVGVATDCWPDGEYVDSMVSSKTLSVEPVKDTTQQAGESTDTTAGVSCLSISVSTKDGSNTVAIGDTVRITGRFYAQETGTFVFEGALPRPPTASMVVSHNICNAADLDYPSERLDVEAGKTYEVDFDAVATKIGTITPQIGVATDCYPAGKYVSSLQSDAKIKVVAAEGSSNTTTKTSNNSDGSDKTMIWITGLIIVVAGLVVSKRK